MIRLFTKNSTGVAPDGRWYAGDVNALQDAVAAIYDLTQSLGIGSLALGEAGLQLVRYGAGEARLTGLMRVDGIFRALGGDVPGAFTTTARDAIPAGSRPYGLRILNTITNQFEWNAGTDAVPNWQPLGGGVVDIPLRLDQRLVPAAGTTLYTVPAGKQVRYEKMRISNTDAVNPQSITVYDGGSGAGNTIMPATEIPPNDSIELEMRGMGQQAGGTIAALASTAGVLAASLYGSVEDPTTKLYKRLFQGTPGAAFSQLIAFAARTKVTHIRAANVGASVRGLGLGDGGSAAVNIIQPRDGSESQIEAGGVMEFIDEYFAFANGGSLHGAVSGGANDVVVTVYGVEG